MTVRRIKRAQRLKSVGRAPVWLKTAAIAKRGHGQRITGTFGAASEAVSIDPKTGLPREDQS